MKQVILSIFVAFLLLSGCQDESTPSTSLPTQVEGYQLDPPIAEFLSEDWSTAEAFAEKRAQQREMLMTEGGREQFRAAVDRSWIEGTHVDAEGVRTQEVSIPGPAGDIQAYVVTPTLTADKPPIVMLYFHGGGWLFASNEASLPACRELAAMTGAIVVVADYRLAPEHQYPAAHQDAYAAYAWVVDNARSLGGSGRVAVGGDSAGGNMAMSVAINQIMQDGQIPDGLLLNYPVVDMNAEDYASYKTFAIGYSLDKYFAELSEGLFLADPSVKNDTLASPLLYPDLSKLPPTVIATAGFDILRDQGRSLASRLEEIDRPVIHLEFGSLIHGYLQHTTWSAAAVKATEETAAAVVELIGVY